MALWIRIQDISENKPYHSKGSLAFNQMEHLVTMVGSQQHDAAYHLQFTRSGFFIFMKGDIAGELIFVCDRCLGSFPYFQQEQVDLTLLPAHPSNHPVGDLALSPDELEVRTYQGEWLDILEILEEQMSLGLPMKKVCSESCKGICSQCGNNLNQQNCICPATDPSEHPFGGLVQ